MSIFSCLFPKESVPSTTPVLENPDKTKLGSVVGYKRYISEQEKKFYAIRVNNKPILEMLTPEKEPRSLRNWKNGDKLFYVVDAKKIKFEPLKNGVIKITIDNGLTITQLKSESHRGDKNPKETLNRCKKYMQDNVIFYVDPQRQEFYPNFNSSAYHPEVQKSTGYHCYPDIPVRGLTQDQALSLLKKLQSFYVITPKELIAGLKDGSMALCYNDHGLTLTRMLNKDTKEVVFISASKGEIASRKLESIEDEGVAAESEDLLYEQGYFNSKTHTKVALYLESCSALPELYQEYKTKEGLKGIINGEAAKILTHIDIQRQQISSFPKEQKDLNFLYK